MDRCAGAQDRFLFTNAWPTRGGGRLMRCDPRAWRRSCVPWRRSPLRETTTARSWRITRSSAKRYFIALIGVELAIVLLAAPAATAGAICLDRARGTLAHMLMTDLSDSEIVLGKLAARLLPVLGLVACTWPVMAISSLLGGIDPIALTLAFAIIVAVAVLGCSIALAISVWARSRTR